MLLKSSKITIDIDHLPSASDFIKAIFCILKFLIVEKQQIPSNTNYDGLRKVVNQPESESGGIGSEMAPVVASRVRLRNSRMRARNQQKLNSYVNQMEVFLEELSRTLQANPTAKELVIVLGPSVNIAKDVLVVEVPPFSNGQEECLPMKRLLPKVLESLLSNPGALDFFSRRTPITNIHALLKSSANLDLPEVQSLIGTSRSCRLTVEFIAKSVPAFTPSVPASDLDSIDEDFDKQSPLFKVGEGKSDNKKKGKPVRRLFFSTPKGRNQSPAHYSPSTEVLSHSSGNISGVISLDSWSESTPSPASFESITYRYYKICEPVKGLKLMDIK